MDLLLLFYPKRLNKKEKKIYSQTTIEIRENIHAHTVKRYEGSYMYVGGIQIGQSTFNSWLKFDLGQNTILSKCLSLPGCVNK